MSRMYSNTCLLINTSGQYKYMALQLDKIENLRCEAEILLQ